MAPARASTRAKATTAKAPTKAKPSTTMAKKAGVKKTAPVSTTKKKTTASTAETKKTKLKTDAARAAVGASAKATTKRKMASNTRAADAVEGAPAPPARKRKTSAEEEVEKAAVEPKPKKARVAKAPVTRKPKPKVVINKAPSQKLRVFVCGEGSQGELGLGSAKGTVDVKRPRLNALLAAEDVGVVQVAAGGMHCVALTHDGKVLTWGVNDQGALGRDTTWEGGLKDIDDAKSDCSSDSGSDSGLNPHESTPTALPSDAFPEETIIVQVAAGDSSSFALTDDGLVYGWGTFRGNEGILGFDAETKVQATPKLIPGLKKITHIACGDNHALAIDSRGAVFAWGSGQQNQLGRRIVERNKLNGLQPREFGLPKNIVHVGCGSFHSFAVHKSGKVYGWGLNSYCETGIQQGAGDDEAVILHPTVIDSLNDKSIVQICGGSHHTIARTADGECLAWGRIDGFQSGLKVDTLSDSAVIKDDRDRPRVLFEPTAVPGFKADYVAAGADHSIAIDNEGRAWTWGFSANYQTGQGTDDDIEVATIVDNTAVRGKKLNTAGAGGQFSIFTAVAE
ncbi:RNA transporter 2 [Nannizzia gypsea CBS 118893]|uniref:RNA transporter 2 n=1 Tax=Arthroderma gypseum (strain ATCC MYA-4604 / CBS 118893) TaxID=535722 RepID=E4V610_ARTGP|nr:RNA transporter 2 [Nannizzia gypsea CBS 118893]EFR05535.1 RNA transporter 2 [Nannizzia gypsea CBS 118893]